MYGQKMGTLNVKISTTGKFLYTISGDQGSGWKSLEIPISQQGNYQVIFEGIIGDGYQSDIAIDDITFTPGLCQSKPTDQPVRPTQPVQTQPPSQTVECNFDHENTCSFTNAKNDTFDWIVISGATPSSGTGPSRDVSGAGSYAYIEASSPRRLGDLAKLVSPKIPAGYRCLKFRYHMNGRNMGTLTVYLDNSEIFKQSRSQGNKWIKQEISIESQSSYKVVFEGKRGNGWQGDIAIDEVSIAPGKCSSTGTSRPPIPTTSGSKPPSGSCGQKGPGLSDFPKIVGGQQANPGEWPWQVSLLRGSFPFCGGSIVSNQYVITAAHCVKAKDWSKIKVRIGEHDLGKTEGHEKDISIARNGIIVHPNYNSRRTDYDIAIIKLSTTIQHTRMVKPVCINRGTDFTGQRCYITGWGRLRSGGSTPKILQEAQVPIVTNAECKKAYGSRITDRMFCAGYSKGGIDTCQGDSGGPLVCKHRDGSWHLTGLTSWGKGCASAGYYGVYAHVANLYSWVNQVTGL